MHNNWRSHTHSLAPTPPPPGARATHTTGTCMPLPGTRTNRPWRPRNAHNWHTRTTPWRPRPTPLASAPRTQLALTHNSLAPTPRRRRHLEDLRAREVLRSEEFRDMMQAYAAEGVLGVEAQGPGIQERLVHLVSCGRS